jgi:hypothetical protein
MARERRLHWLIILWLLFGFVIWNVIFDYEIRVATDEYLALQGAHDAGRGPSVTIDAVMGPAKMRGLRRASAWAGAAAAAGIALTLAVARKR